MQTLPLFPTAPLAPVETTTPCALNPACRACGFHATARRVCLPAEGEPGGALFVGEHPGLEEDRVGRVFVGGAGKLLRTSIAKNWKGPFAIDNALRCYPGDKQVTPDAIKACRGYLAKTVSDAKPTRVVALGSGAVVGLLGRSVSIQSVRRGYGWLYNGGVPVPVFFVLHPAAALRNRFVRQWFEDDIAWALTTSTPPVPTQWTSHASVIESVADAEQAARSLRAAPWFAFDVEATGHQFARDYHLISLAACAAYSSEVFVWDRSALQIGAMTAPLRALLSDPTVRKVGQHVKYDMQAVWRALGVHVMGVDGDTRLERKLLQADADADLETLSELVGLGGHKEEAHVEVLKACKHIRALRKRAVDAASTRVLPGFERAMTPLETSAVRDLASEPKRYAYGFVNRPVLTRYNGRDALTTARVEERVRPALEQVPALASTWRKLVRPIVPALARIEQWGVLVDQDALRVFGAMLDVRAAEKLDRLHVHGLADPNSNNACAKFLYEQLKLPVLAQTKGGAPSTDAEVLDKLRDKHAAVGDLLDYRGIVKLKGTYVDGLAAHIAASIDGRVHPTLNPDGAETGRASSEDPNLQNIPRPDSEEGRMLRACFVAPPGHVLLELDYSQIELRVVAMLSGDQEMIRIFREGADYHMRTAQLVAPIVWKMRPEDVTGKERSAAKGFNFGLLYGMADASLAKKIGCTIAEAAKLRAAIFGKMRRLQAWVNERIAEARRTGVVWTHWDGEPARRRPLWRIASEDSEQRSRAEHGAFNTDVQGSASEYLTASISETVQWILDDEVPAKLVMPVHDSLLLEVREDTVDETLAQVRRIMTSWPAANGVPLVADAKIGSSWADLKKVKMAA